MRITEISSAGPGDRIFKEGASIYAPIPRRLLDGSAATMGGRQRRRRNLAPQPKGVKRRDR